MEKYNRNLFIEYKATTDTYELALKLTEKLGKINTRMKDLFDDYKVPSRLFAFIESKFSSKIEGIYTTLFDVVNTGTETNQQQIIKPLVNALLREDKLIKLSMINELAQALNEGKNKQQRYSNNFGIWNHKTKEKIYEPLLNKEDIDNELDFFWSKQDKTETNIIKIIWSHLWFEKIHPYIDGNGRVGRLIMNRKVAEITNFSNLLPISWAIFKSRDKYYDAFILNSQDDLDKGIRQILEIMLFMYDKIKGFISDLKIYVSKYYELIMSSSTKMSDKIAKDILFSLQTKQSFLIYKYKLNPRTIKSIFDNISQQMDLNVKFHGREKIFWNIEMETIIEKWFGE